MGIQSTLDRSSIFTGTMSSCGPDVDATIDVYEASTLFGDSDVSGETGKQTMSELTNHAGPGSKYDGGGGGRGKKGLSKEREAELKEAVMELDRIYKTYHPDAVAYLKASLPLLDVVFSAQKLTMYKAWVAGVKGQTEQICSMTPIKHHTALHVYSRDLSGKTVTVDAEMPLHLDEMKVWEQIFRKVKAGERVELVGENRVVLVSEEGNACRPVSVSATRGRRAAVVMNVGF